MGINAGKSIIEGKAHYPCPTVSAGHMNSTNRSHQHDGKEYFFSNHMSVPPAFSSIVQKPDIFIVVYNGSSGLFFIRHAVPLSIPGVNII
jgi:hypothetical protein